MASRSSRSKPQPLCDASDTDRYPWYRDFPRCRKRGAHRCTTRVAHVVAFFSANLVHTKGRWARQPFHLSRWQRIDIIGPLFGDVRWDAEAGRYVRKHRVAWIELARKNGKSELLAGIALYLLCADGEEGAEVYGAARDRDQARIVWDVAFRMVQLSPVLSGVLTLRSHEKRIVYQSRGSFYTPLAADALGNLGQNPHGILFDEIIAQRDGRLWNAQRTGMGARVQPLMLAATTAGDDPSSFARVEHNEMLRVQDDPERAPHIFAYIRNVPEEADPWDEKLWPVANPALGDFLSIAALREEAKEARNDPTKENTFRQFRLNQWVQQATRWMPMHLYDSCTGEVWATPNWKPPEGAQDAWVGLDLAARHDLTAMAVWLPKTADMLFRFWLPEPALRDLDIGTSGQATVWVRQGWLTLVDDAVIDYKALCLDIAETLQPFGVREIDYDKWSGEFVRQELERLLGRVPCIPNEPGFSGMTTPMNELMNLTTTGGWSHHGNPVARWCFDAVEVKRNTVNPDLIMPVKPERAAGNHRIDAVPAAALAIGGWKVRGVVPKRRGYGFQ